MAKISENDRNKFIEKISVYRTTIQVINKQEQDIISVVKKGNTDYGVKQLELADLMLDLASNYLIMSGISLSILGQKNEEMLNDARKSLYKSIIYIESIVTKLIDANYSEYEEQLEVIDTITPEQRYRLIRKMGLTIQLVENAYGDNTKWKWAFVDLEGRFAAVAKNIINLRDYFINSDPGSQFYEPTVFHLRLSKKLLEQAATRFREKYELSTNQIDDFKTGIQFLSALKRLNFLTGDQLDAEITKKKLDTWTNKLASDINKQEKPPSGRKG